MKITDVTQADAHALTQALVSLASAPLPAGFTYSDASRAQDALNVIQGLATQAHKQLRSQEEGSQPRKLKAVTAAATLSPKAPTPTIEQGGFERTDTAVNPTPVKRSRGRPKKRA